MQRRCGETATILFFLYNTNGLLAVFPSFFCVCAADWSAEEHRRFARCSQCWPTTEPRLGVTAHIRTETACLFCPNRPK